MYRINEEGIIDLKQTKETIDNNGNSGAERNLDSFFNANNKAENKNIEVKNKEVPVNNGKVFDENN
ncbi:MAG: hypothetical protein H7641_15605, partial [Candidatus Heimdallarchaeota archaeon]|nr:hypothetical protein [Candidatus Heimdallarchaeota archaeon]MCK4878985.1 hypothetical protein [Candidatus Heimdallarchaeota archaeon]